MKKLPTDRQVLRCIYDMYKAEYPGVPGSDGRPINDPFLPVNLNHIAGHLGCPPEIIFGRLYYHLNHKYSYERRENVDVSFFYVEFKGRTHCVQFPLLASVLASLDEDNRRQLWALRFSFVALVISIAAIVAQVATAK
jgi:hypothetical protein